MTAVRATRGGLTALFIESELDGGECPFWACVPAHLIVLGSGPVGTELTTAFRQLGSKVTLISSSARLLSKFDLEAGNRVLESLAKMGVDVKVSRKVTSIKRSSEGIEATLDGGEVITCSEILISTGRKVRTTDLGLEAVGIPGNGARTSVDYSMCSKEVADG
jgi:pyruvate/2-oxoglutarate dehydrogenase complex dihydrolipoamide dehydrogenase (E3) component